MPKMTKWELEEQRTGRIFLSLLRRRLQPGQDEVAADVVHQMLQIVGPPESARRAAWNTYLQACDENYFADKRYEKNMLED